MRAGTADAARPQAVRPGRTRAVVPGQGRTRAVVLGRGRTSAMVLGRGGSRMVVLGLTAVLLPSLLAGGCSGRAEAGGGERTVVVTMHHSRFEPREITVRPGSTVRFVVRNTDPIDHELILGDDAVQQWHERGTDAHHDGPGQVSVPAGEERTTTFTFNWTGAGRLEYACHLPGHYAYGMRGVVHVRPG